MTRNVRSHHYRRDGSIARSLRAPAAFPWAGVDEENLFLAMDGYLGITLNGANVSAWADQSSQANDGSQGTASKQPAYSTSNGKPSLLFDGTDDFIEVLNVTGHAAGDDVTVFCVANIALSVRASLYESGTMANKVDRGLWLDTRVTGADNIRVRAHDAGGSHVIDDAGNSAGTYIFETTHEDDLTSFFIDGVASGTANTPTVTLLAQTHIGIGGRGNGGNPFDSHFHSLLMWKGLMSADNKTTVRDRLATRWGLSI